MSYASSCIECDECGTYIEDGDNVYCERCFESKMSKANKDIVLIELEKFKKMILELIEKVSTMEEE